MSLEIRRAEEYQKLLKILNIAWVDGMGLPEINALRIIIQSIHWSRKSHAMMLEAAGEIVVEMNKLELDEDAHRKSGV